MKVELRENREFIPQWHVIGFVLLVAIVAGGIGVGLAEFICWLGY